MNKHRLCTLAIAFLISILAFPLAFGPDAQAGGGIPKKVKLKFHNSSNVNAKLGDGNTALVTVNYDGKMVCYDRIFKNNWGWREVTTDYVHESANIEVHIRVYDKSNKLLGEKRWNQKFGNGVHSFNIEANPRYWAFSLNMRREHENVYIIFG